MMLTKFFQLVGRHLLLVILGFLAALGAGAGVFVESPQTYELKARFLLVSPSHDAEGKVVNPFLDLGNAVPSLADVLATSLSAGETSVDYASKYPGTTYTAARDVDSKAPIVQVAVSGSSERSVSTVLDGLALDMSADAKAIQQSAGAPESLWVRTTQLTRDTRPTVVYTVPLRNGIGATVAVLVVDFLVVGVADRRRAKSVRRGRDLAGEHGYFGASNPRVTPINAHAANWEGNRKTVSEREGS